MKSHDHSPPILITNLTQNDSRNQPVSAGRKSSVIGQTNHSELNSKSYRQAMTTINESFQGLDAFTDHLERKVDSLLKAQEEEFVASYKTHMHRIKHEFARMEAGMRELEEKVKYYQNEGQMSKLVMKVHKLEEESKDIYAALALRDKRIKQLQISLKVYKEESKRLQGRLKKMLREKNEHIYMASQENSLELNVFATETQKSRPQITLNPEILTKKHSYLDSKPINSFASKDYSMRSVNKTQDEDPRHDRLEKQMKGLRLKNKKLVSFQSVVMTSQMEMENFFLQCVEEIKKQIRIRKKMTPCTLDDFRKEDKINLLIKVLSNDTIISHLHQRLFSHKSELLPHLVPQLVPQLTPHLLPQE